MLPCSSYRCHEIFILIRSGSCNLLFFALQQPRCKKVRDNGSRADYVLFRCWKPQKVPCFILFHPSPHRSRDNRLLRWPSATGKITLGTRRSSLKYGINRQRIAFFSTPYVLKSSNIRCDRIFFFFLVSFVLDFIFFFLESCARLCSPDRTSKSCFSFPSRYPVFPPPHPPPPMFFRSFSMIPRFLSPLLSLFLIWPPATACLPPSCACSCLFFLSPPP